MDSGTALLILTIITVSVGATWKISRLLMDIISQLKVTVSRMEDHESRIKILEGKVA